MHSEERTGFSTKFRRISFRVGDEYIPVPVLSGNSIRGVLRRLGASHLLDKVGLAPADLSDAAYYVLFSGGILLKGEKTAAIPEFKAGLRTHNPFLSLFGSAVRQEMLMGKLRVGMAIPICQETADYTGQPSTVSFFDLLQEVSYTRRDDREEKSAETLAAEDKHQMRYVVEVLAAGSELAHSFSLRRVNELETSCFYTLLRLFAERPYLGGMSNIGHGYVSWTYPTGDTALYEQWLDDNREGIAAHLVADLS